MHVDLTEQEWGQLMNILATTKEWPWTVTNPFLMKIGEQLRAQSQIIHNPSALKANGPEKEVRHE